MRLENSFLVPHLPQNIALSYLGEHAPSLVQATHAERVSIYMERVETPGKAHHFCLTHLPDHAYYNSLENKFVLVFTLSTYPFIYELLMEQSDHSLLANLIAHYEKPIKKFKIGTKSFPDSRPHLMGVLNLTPDSFFDGGKYQSTGDALNRAKELVEAGADIIDLGAESTRPGASEIEADEELHRLMPVLKALKSQLSVPISIDTRKPRVAKECLEAGADMINDVSGLASRKEMIDLIKKHHASYCLTHTKGDPETMQDAPEYDDVVFEVFSFLSDRLKLIQDWGLSLDRVLIDPGIGFGKTMQQNLDLLRMLPAFSHLGAPLLLGASNKSLYQKALNLELERRDPAHLATLAISVRQGAGFFRVHTPETARAAVDMAALYMRRESVEPT